MAICAVNLPIAALVALASHIKRWVPRPRMRRARWTSPAADSTPRRRRPCRYREQTKHQTAQDPGSETSTEIFGLATWLRSSLRRSLESARRWPLPPKCPTCVPV